MHSVLRRPAVTVLLGLLAVTASAVGSPVAHADPPPWDEQYHVGSVTATQNPNEDLVTSFAALPVDDDGGYVRDGIRMRLVLSSCGNRIATQEVTASPRGGKAFIVNFTDAQTKLVGRALDYTVTFRHPGYDPYTAGGSYDGYNVKRPSCQEINHPLRPRWSTKKQTATLVGRTVSVTPTTAPGARVTYAWKALDRFGHLRGPVLGTRPGLRVRSAWVGRRLGVGVVVRKPGYLAQSRQLLFAKVRRG